MKNPFRYFNSSPEIIHLAVMMYVRYPLSVRLAIPVSTDEFVAIGKGGCNLSVPFAIAVFTDVFSAIGIGIAAQISTW